MNKKKNWVLQKTPTIAYQALEISPAGGYREWKTKSTEMKTGYMWSRDVILDVSTHFLYLLL